MKKMILQIGLLAFIVFSATVLLGEKLNVFYNLFPDPETTRSYIVTGSAIAIFASLGMIVVRTLLGILSVLILAVIVFLALKMNLINILLQNIP